MKVLCVALLALLLACVQVAVGKDCEVCVKLLESVEADFKEAQKAAKAAKEKFNAMEKIEALVDSKCDAAKSSADKKVCYYLRPIKRKISTPMSNFAPPDRVCKKLKKEAPELCAVREAVKIEKGKTDYNALKIRDLKKILADRGAQCKNCLEKAEFVKRCKETEDMEHDEL